MSDAVELGSGCKLELYVSTRAVCYGLEHRYCIRMQINTSSLH